MNDLPSTATCNECHATFTLSNAASHVCQDEFKAGRGYCEDYPCCGHRQGECADRAEFTSEYWSELNQRLGGEAYEDYLERLEDQEMLHG